MNINTNKLKEIILEEIHIDVDDQTRRREIIQGRIIYCKILRDMGWTTARIGKSIDKSHSTVIYHVNKFKEDEEIYGDQSSVVKNYRIIKNKFFKHTNNEFMLSFDKDVLQIEIESII
tara:strand:+ start:74 stop:427 length:354 start_codon:yes stop_codon:yes gene_type:complete